TERRQAGWSFLFLGADQDSYASGEGMAVAARNIANWDKSTEGTAKMWRDAAHSTSGDPRRPRYEGRSRNDGGSTAGPEAGCAGRLAFHQRGSAAVPVRAAEPQRRRLHRGPG